MNWILLVAVTIFADAIAVYFDNYITDVFFKEKHAIAQRLFYGIFYIVFAIILITIFGFDFAAIPIQVLVTFILSGILSSLAGIPYYRALECDDSTNLGIFFQFTPILFLIFNFILFGKAISPIQIVAMLVILAAPATIILTTQKRSRKTHIRSMLLTLLSMSISVIGSLVFVNNNTTELGFITEIIPVLIGYGISNVTMVLVIPKWRRRFFHVVKKNKHKVLIPMTCDAILSTAKMIAYRGALILAPSVAIASAASDAIEPVVIFFIGIVLTIIWPQFGREKLNKKSVLVHLIATVLVVIGIVLMQF